MLLPAMTYWDTELKQFVHQTIMQDNGTPLVNSNFLTPHFAGRADSTLKIKIKLLNDKAKMPTRSNPDDAGMDLYAAEDAVLESRHNGTVGCDESVIRDPSRVTISTGLAFEIPQGLAMFIWDRSGLSSKEGIHRVAGVLDSSYRGELKVALVNLSNKNYQIKAGDKIAQAIIAPIILPELIKVDELSKTARGAGGFGSTGK